VAHGPIEAAIGSEAGAEVVVLHAKNQIPAA
jgi:hypothetical protein